MNGSVTLHMRVLLAAVIFAFTSGCAEKPPAVEVVAQSANGLAQSLVRPDDISCVAEDPNGALELRLTPDAARRVQAYIEANPSITLRLMVEGELNNEVRPRSPFIVGFWISGASGDGMGRLASQFQSCQESAT